MRSGAELDADGPKGKAGQETRLDYRIIDLRVSLLILGTDN